MPPWVWPCRISGLTARPTVVDVRVAHDLDHAGLGIDLDLADRAAVGKGARRGMVSSLIAVERAAQVIGQVVRARSAAAATSNRPSERSVPFTLKRPSREFDVGRVGLQQWRGDARRPSR